MNAYGSLAGFYDELTQDVAYEDFADYYERLFAADGGTFRLLLDLCCGTGTLACLMAERGYEMIAVDASEDMLAEGMDKAYDLPEGCIRPMFICQQAAGLDLYGTVDAAYSSLDSFSYIPPEQLPEIFRRLRLFIRPGGILVFDIRTPAFLQRMDGEISVDETEDVLCLWRGSYDQNCGALRYGMDIFYCEDEYWMRASEEHVEYAHEPEALLALLEQHGFAAEIRTDGPQGGPDRVFLAARRI